VQPVVISIPHGGTATPPELADRVCLTARDQFDDSDPHTVDIYDVGADVRRVVKAEVARAFVDLNRAPDDRPPANPDGVVKSMTCFERPIYHPGREPDGRTVDRLLDRYYHPYHRALDDAARDPAMVLGLDCHSMLAAPPPIAPDHTAPRPLFCLSNGNGTTCPPTLLAQLASVLANAFECDRGEIALNRPFTGGYITRRHGNRPLPWIQVEVNRSLYLSDPWFDETTLAVDPSRLADLNGRFRAALSALAI
jgi:N-formylglutamate deformylase